MEKLYYLLRLYITLRIHVKVIIRQPKIDKLKLMTSTNAHKNISEMLTLKSPMLVTKMNL